MFTRKQARPDGSGHLNIAVPVRPQLTEIRLEQIPEAPAMAASSGSDGLVIIGKGTRVFGQIADCQKLEVYGVIEADVVAEMIVVHEGGGLKGNVQTDKANIHGVIEGSLQVFEHLEIHSTGDISGDVSYGSLSVAAGARLIGSVQAHANFPSPAADHPMAVDPHPVQADLNGSANGQTSHVDAIAFNPSAVLAARRPSLRH